MSIDTGISTIRISDGMLSAEILSQGAALRNLFLDRHPNSLILQHGHMDQYRENHDLLGAIVGRFANRIKGAAFKHDDALHELDRNWLQKHCLHGGANAIAHKNWVIEDHNQNSVVLSTVDREVETGFPGECEIRVTYSMPGGGRLELEILAKCTRSTPCSITAHPYFNLGLTDHVSAHVLQIPANRFLQTDDEKIPTGRICDVVGTRFDFTVPKRIAHDDFDENFCLSTTRHALRNVAIVYAPDSKIRMEVWSNETGLQFYNGSGLTSPFERFQGFCLEPQGWPDAPNQTSFPNTILDPHEVYRHSISYRFTRDVMHDGIFRTDRAIRSQTLQGRI